MVWTQSLSAKERKALGKKLADSRKGKYKSFSDEHKRKLSISNKISYLKRKEAGLVKKKPCKFSEEEIAFNHVRASYSQGAKRRMLGFNLTKEQLDIMISSDCFYCGAPPHERYIKLRVTAVRVIANGIDRVDNSKPYDFDNCVPCCTSCNLMKHKLSFKDFKSKIERIYKKICL